MTYLIDTDSLIDMVRGLKIVKPRNARERERFRSANRLISRCRDCDRLGDDLGVSAITVAELEYGARRGGSYLKEMSAVHKILTPFVAYPFDATFCATHYGEIRHTLETRGTPIGAMDLLIAGQAKALNATLVTRNTSHFSRVQGLSFEDWTK